MTGALVATMLTGCGSSSDAGSSSGAGSSSEAGGTTDLSKVELTVGTSGTYAPFSYFKEDGKTLQGFDVELLKALQDKLGFIHPVTYRIYRNWDDLQEYQIIGISNARRVLEEK